MRRPRRASFPVMTDQTVLTNATDTVARVADSDRPASRSVTVEGDWQVEELTHARLVTGPTGRWTFVLVAALGGLIGLGFAGHWSDPRGTAVTTFATASAPAATLPTSPEAEAGLTLTRPQDGDEIVGGSIEIRASTLGPLGRIHVAAIVGGMEIGAIDVDVVKAGRLIEMLPVLAPPWAVAAEVRVSETTGAEAGKLLARRSVVVSPDRSVALLLLSARQTKDRLAVSVYGVAQPGLGTLEMKLLDERGTVLGAASPTLGGGEGWGGVLLSSVPFWASLEIAPVAAGTQLHLTITWLDPASGSAMTVSRLLVGPIPASALHPG
jgi:hypothetical protein